MFIDVYKSAGLKVQLLVEVVGPNTSILAFPSPLTIFIQLMTYKGLSFFSIAVIDIITKSNLERKGLTSSYNSQVRC